MAKSRGKTSKSLLKDEDLLDSLFDDKKLPARANVARSGLLSRTSATDNIFSMLAEEVKRDGVDSEDSDVSAADPDDLLKNMKDMDDMDADLFASKKKPSSAPAQTKTLGNEGPKKDAGAPGSTNVKPEGADEPAGGARKPNSAPSSTARSHKKFTFSDGGGGGENLDQTPHTKDIDDPLADLLDDLLPEENDPGPKPLQTKAEKSAPPPASSPLLKRETTRATKKSELEFDDDDLMVSLGFDSDKNNPKKRDGLLWSSKERSEAPQRARTRIDEILESFTSPQLLERPPTGERKDEAPAQRRQQQERTPTLRESFLDEDITFGSYQPTVGSTPEGRQSRRQSVKFSTDDVSASTPERKPKPTTPVSLRHRNSADWLGLKTSDAPSYQEDEAKVKKASESPKTPSSPLLERKSSFTGGLTMAGAKKAEDTKAESDTTTAQTKSDTPKVQRKEEEEDDDWLGEALSRKKNLSASNREVRISKQDESSDLGSKVGLESTASKQSLKQAPRRKDDTFLSAKETSDTFFGEPSPTAHSTPLREETTRPVSENIAAPKPSNLTSPLTVPPHAEVDVTAPYRLPHSLEVPAQVTGGSPATVISVSDPKPRAPSSPSGGGSRTLNEPRQADDAEQQPSQPRSFSAVAPGAVWFPPQSQTQNISAAVQPQVMFSADNLQQLLLQQQMMQTQLLGLGSVVDAGVLQRPKDKEQQPGEYQALQARIILLEGQVKTLQLERDQSQLMLENIQQRHKQDVELIESTHKARVKLLEDSASQRETRARHECEDLMERLAAVTRSAEQERSELQAQYHRKLAQAQQDRDREVDRLRDLQRKSILEMKKDHEDQVHRLKRLKEEEIDAVTSATSQTRSLSGVIEQMELFSSRLGELSSRVESTHEHTAHGLEQGARHRDEQLRTMQDRLAQQQKAMTDERAYLKEIISRMDTQLNEQQRQLEKERWKMTAEQAKAESTQRGLEEERRVLGMQISVEREELERAKGALLEEQKSVMQHCADERRKLAAEWAHFHAQEKQRQERAERQVSSLMEKREGSIISLAQEQADLKLRTAELKQKELAVGQERETVERLREELDREKERVSSTALRLKTRAQEVEAFSKLAAEKYEEGERAMREAKRVEGEHEARLRNVHSQTEHLRQQEQRFLKERMRLSHLQDSERLRENPPAALLPQIAPVLPDSVSMLPKPELAAALNFSPPCTSLPNHQAMALQASLALWKYTAEKDREYLQDEQMFLENLKKKSYRSLWNMH